MEISVDLISFFSPNQQSQNMKERKAVTSTRENMNPEGHHTFYVGICMPVHWTFRFISIKYIYYMTYSTAKQQYLVNLFKISMKFFLG